MISLDELSELSRNVESKHNAAMKIASVEQLAKYDKVYHDAIDKLESKLRKAALDGIK